MVKFHIVGSLAVEREGVNVSPTATKQQQVLGLLLLRSNTTLTVPKLTAELWGDGIPPRTATAAIHTYIKQLRKIIVTEGETGEEKLVTTPTGYELNVAGGQLDIHEFDQRLSGARRHLSDHRWCDADRELSRALSAWREPLLADVSIGPVLRSTIASRKEEWLSAVEEHTWLSLRFVHPSYFIAELSGLVLDHPANETLAAQLMIALYRAGRTSDALNTFYRFCALHRRSASAAPPPAIEAVYSAILQGRPELDEASWHPPGFHPTGATATDKRKVHGS